MSDGLTDGLLPALTPAIVGFFDAEAPTLLVSSMASVFSGNWKKRFRTARWRGIPFYTREHDAQFGRRVQVFEYAQRDIPYAEDLGRSARQFQIRGYLVGGDYMGARDRLRAACEQAGPGQLVHPYLGTFSVVCTAVRIRETEQEGGFCVLEFSFVEAGSLLDQFVSSFVGGLLASAGLSVSTAAIGAFATGFATQGFANWVGVAALGNITALTGTLHGLGSLSGLGSGLSGLLPFSASRRATARTPPLATVTQFDLADPAAIGQRVVDAIAALATSSAPETALRNLELLFAYEVPPLSPPLPPITPDRVQEQANAAALAQLVHQAAAAAIPTPLLNIAPTTYDALATYRSDLLDAIDGLELEATDDAVYLALQGLGAAISAQLTEFGASLRPLVPYTTALPRPALTLAQRFYQDFTRADELVTLTNAVHPGFMPTSGLIASS